MPDIAHEFNIPIQNMSWVAAFLEQGHPHTHYMLCGVTMTKSPLLIHKVSKIDAVKFLVNTSGSYRSGIMCCNKQQHAMNCLI